MVRNFHSRGQCLMLCSRWIAVAMSPCTPCQIARDTNVKGSVGLVGHDVDPTPCHLVIVVGGQCRCKRQMDGRDTPGHDGLSGDLSTLREACTVPASASHSNRRQP